MENIKIGTTVKHKTAGYIANIKEIHKNGNGVLTINKAIGDFANHIPFDINAKDIKKWFIVI